MPGNLNVYSTLNVKCTIALLYGNISISVTVDCSEPCDDGCQGCLRYSIPVSPLLQILSAVALSLGWLSFYRSLRWVLC